MRLFVPFLIMALNLCAATAEDEIRNAEKSWISAVKSRDIAALDKLFTPELIYGHASGAIETKQKSSAVCPRAITFAPIVLPTS